MGGTNCKELSHAVVDVYIIAAKSQNMQEHHMIPLTEDALRAAGVGSFGCKGKGEEPLKDPKHKDPAVRKLENGEETSSSQPLVTIGTGLPALPKKLLTRVRANEYIDFSELPPAKGKGRPMPQFLEYRGPGGRAVADQKGYS
jgi:hypothetical protein